MAIKGGGTGASLSEGERILNADYDVEVDRRPEELTSEFLDQYSWAMDDVEEEWDQIVEDARNFALDEIVHVGAIARDENVDMRALDDERIEAQSEDGILKMSYVWDGEWRGLRGGTCQERALTLHALYNELGIDSQYHEGALKLEDGRYGGHGWTTVEDQYISDPSNAGDGVTLVEDTERYTEKEIWVR